MSQEYSKYAHDGQQRVLRLISALAGHELLGAAPGDLAKAQDCSPSLITKDLANLALAGFAEHVPATGRWRLSPHIVQIALKHMTALDHAEKTLADTRNRYSRS